ncbi:hypothetical protein ACFLZ7_03120 [Nanoarchaeota archaeon]
MRKKAQVEVQFNWIFVLIVGVILLAFFIMVVNKQRGAAETVLSADVLSELDKVIAGVTVSSGTTFLIEMPDVPIVYECGEGCACSIAIEGSGAQDIPIRNNPVFAPDRLRGQKIVMWSQEFNAPFRATNFFYMTSPQERYLVEDAGLGQYLYDELPPKTIIEDGTEQPAFTKELFNADNLTELIDRNNYKLKFVFVETDPEDVFLPPFAEAMPNADVSAVKIDEDTNEIRFYQKRIDSFEETGRTSYIESSTLYASVFSESKEMYECMMDIAFENLNVVGQVYLNRSLVLYKGYENNTECRIYYDTLYLEDYIIGETDEGFSQADIRVLREGIEGLSSQNEGAIVFSCAAIY